MSDSATKLEIYPKFERITVDPPLIDLAQTVIDELSTNQYYSYMIGSGIKTRVMHDRLAYLQIGPVSHSRWLKMAQVLQNLHCSSKTEGEPASQPEAYFSVHRRCLLAKLIQHQDQVIAF